MDPGTVVWLPGTGWGGGELDNACQEVYGGDYYACGEYYDSGYTVVYCCG